MYTTITLASFMYRVDELCITYLGVSSEDLPDFNWRDAWESGDTPDEAFSEFISDNGWDYNLS